MGANKKIIFIVFLIGLGIFSSGAYAADLTIISLTNITNNCPYDSVSRTYSCTGWENIYVQSDISLPVVGCRSSRGDTFGCTATNIVFSATNEFSAKNFYSVNYGGSGGSITIASKKIAALSLNTYGSGCHGDCNYAKGYRCDSANGGPITLSADEIDIQIINANDGNGDRGSAGAVNIVGRNITVQTIASNGATYECYYGFGDTDGAGSGGSVTVKANNAKIDSISMNGGESSYCDRGGSGGSAKIVADNLTLGSVSANGAYGGGSGGSTKIYADSYALSSVTGSGGGSNSCRGGGPGGSIAFFTDSAYPSSGLDAGTIKLGKRSGGGFFTFETNIPSQYKSFRIKIKDAISGEYVKSIYNVEYSLDGAASGGYIKAFIGLLMRLNLKLGNDYLLVVTGSTDPSFDSSRCGSGAACRDFIIPFAEY